MCGTCSCGTPEAPAPASDPPHQIVLERHLLAHNDGLAAVNRQRFDRAGLKAFNLLSSPGSGKTALLERLATHQPTIGPMAVLVGDLATDLDALRLRAAGLPAVALTTGHICHLEAAMVARGLDALEAGGTALGDLTWLLIENVGNLVCPAAFQLGEHRRLVLLSVTEGTDKPLKYPALFRSADLVVITKLDLAAAVAFDPSAARRAIQQVAPQAQVVAVSARSGEGIDALLHQIGRG